MSEKDAWEDTFNNLHNIKEKVIIESKRILKANKPKNEQVLNDTNSMVSFRYYLLD